MGEIPIHAEPIHLSNSEKLGKAREEKGCADRVDLDNR